MKSVEGKYALSKRKILLFFAGLFVMMFMMIMPQQQVHAATNGVAQASDGNWYYYQKNKINYSYSGLGSYGGSWWYFKNGKLDFSYTGLCQYNGSWWYVQNGKVNFKATTLCQYGGTWWYVQNGKVNFKATTLCQYGGTWWYVQNGKVNFKATTLCQYNGSWWYVQNGKVNFKATTLCQYYGTWWYVQNGKVNFKATTLCQYYGTWWYVENGKVNFNYTGVAEYGQGYWYVKNGKIDWNYSGQVVSNGSVYKVVKGKATDICNLSKSDPYYKYEVAYRTKDTSGLKNSELTFYKNLKACLDQAYSYKTAYEREKAVHDYIVLNCEYGSSTASSRAEGVFSNKKAICTGYAGAFQLCMDILGIPCITVSGVVDGNAGHVWNSVQLDGDWYVVDVTWDDPVPDKPGKISYQYFNITDAKLRERRTYETPVEATGTKYYYYATLPNYFTVEDGLDAYYDYIQEQYEKVGAGVEITVIVESKDAWEYSDTSAYRDESVLDDSNYYAAVKHFNGVYEFYWSFTKYVYY